MSGDAASLPCPICSLAGVFHSAESLRDRLIHVSTNKILCPVCQEEICGLDKLTIHLFSHVKLLIPGNENDVKSKSTEKKGKLKPENETLIQQKKPRSTSKNRPSTSIIGSPMKYVKIYPKLPVISLNPVPIIDISQRPSEKCIQTSEQVIVKAEASVEQTNTTCNMCGLQFVDKNILKMHRCLIHNIDDTSTESVTRYDCHLCPKNFKMRGSLMVHLRVAHYGILCDNSNVDNDSQDVIDGKNPDQLQKHLDRNDNKQWQCDVCRKYFTTKYFLKKHKRLHTGETPYACTQCNKTFTFQQSYHKHLLYHNDEKPHSCNFCGRAFKELSTLHNHQRIHTGEKPFACETCGKCFRQRVSYLVHRRIHTGVMPYKCTACEKSFRYKVSQRTHKCQAQPPGTVIRQTGDLVEKLKKKQIDPKNQQNINKIEEQQYTYLEISEANAELARTGAKLSLEDMETENFQIFAETFSNEAEAQCSSSCFNNIGVREVFSPKSNQIFENNKEELINTNPNEEKNVPSPSDILRNLCLSSEENGNDIIKDISEYL